MLSEIIAFLNDLLWGKVLIGLLLALGIWFTVGSRFVQFRYFTRMFSVLGKSSRKTQKRTQYKTEDGVSSFQALALSVGGRVGAGNIAGVAVAITLGGPGSVFWMWVIGLIGMATSFFECTLAQLYKHRQQDGTYRGGPAYYIVHGLGKNWIWLAILYSAFLVISFGFAFNALQSFTIASSMLDSFGIQPWVSGVLLSALIGGVIFGGIKRLTHVAEYIVPFMAIGYLLLTVIVILMNFERVPGVFATIFANAFGLQEVVGGGLGSIIIFGVKRGLFSSQAGLGSAPNVAAAAHVRHPVNQGLVQSLSVFIDTIVLCTCTALIILLSTTYSPGSEIGGVTLTQIALSDHVGSVGGMFVSVALFLFGFTSIMYNYYLGENSINFFYEGNEKAFLVLRIVTITLILWGATQNLGTIFGFADLAMALLACANLFAIAKLFKTGKRLLVDFDEQITSGIETPIFDPDKFPDLDIDKESWTLTTTASPQQQKDKPSVAY